jgi:hypothetical protein
MPAAAVTPPVEDMIDRHHDAEEPAHGFAPMPDDEMPSPYWAPAEMGDMDRSALFRSDDLVQIRYGAGTAAVSVFEQAGVLDVSGLADTMDPMTDGAWVLHVGETHALVVERGHLVYTVVGTAPMPELMAVIDELPDEDGRSLLDRVREASTEVVWTFSLGD